MKTFQLQHQEHNISPVFNEKSTILILGSFPSVLSRESAFFYGHPKNRFWQVLATLFHVTLPMTIDEKKNLLFQHHIALWDVIASCEIKGSADSTIQNIVPNDLNVILNFAKINTIYVNGKTAYMLYYKYIYPTIQKEAILLPSTSPANARYRLEQLCEEWKKIKENEYEYKTGLSTPS